jgi:hypothetical protein
MTEERKAELKAEKQARFKTEAFTKPKPRALLPKEKLAIAEFLRTGKKIDAYRSAYSGKKEFAHRYANTFFKRPKIVSALEKALKESKFDDAYAVDTMKKIVDGGMKNIDITRPDTALKALETYFKITGKMGQGPKTPTRIDPETQAKRMGLSELQQSLKELDKKQKRILAIISGSVVTAEEGEIIE